MNKYNAKKTMIDNITFDSKKEANHYLELKLLEKAGLIQDLRLQHKFLLIPKQAKERAVYYIADFVFTENGKEVVEDVKSEITRKNPDYVIKRKLMKWIHGIEIREI